MIIITRKYWWFNVNVGSKIEKNHSINHIEDDSTNWNGSAQHGSKLRIKDKQCPGVSMPFCIGIQFKCNEANAFFVSILRLKCHKNQTKCVCFWSADRPQPKWTECCSACFVCLKRCIEIIMIWARMKKDANKERNSPLEKSNPLDNDQWIDKTPNALQFLWSKGRKSILITELRQNCEKNISGPKIRARCLRHKKIESFLRFDKMQRTVTRNRQRLRFVYARFISTIRR